MLKEEAVKKAFVPKQEVVDVAALRPHPRNYRVHPEDQLAHIVRSIEEHGIYRNVVVSQDGTILAGHGVIEALKKMGRPTVPVIRLPIGPDDPRALKVLIGDNEIGKLGEVDDRALSEILAGLKDMDDLLGTGFDEMMLANLAFVTRPASEVPTFDEAAAWAGLPEFERSSLAPQIMVNFDSEADRDAFFKLIGEPVIHRKFGGKRVWSTWWPSRPKADQNEIRFEEDGPAKNGAEE